MGKSNLVESGGQAFATIREPHVNFFPVCKRRRREKNVWENIAFCWLHAHVTQFQQSLSVTL